jgi:hypothetical protein
MLVFSLDRDCVGCAGNYFGKHSEELLSAEYLEQRRRIEAARDAEDCDGTRALITGLERRAQNSYGSSSRNLNFCPTADDHIAELEDFGLSYLHIQQLENAGVYSIGELVKHVDAVEDFRQCGIKTREAVVAALRNWKSGKQSH